MIISYSAVILSGSLAATAFLIPHYCWWFIFIFLIPVFYVNNSRSIIYSFKHGMVWGILFLGLHMQGLLRVMVTKAQSPMGAFIWLVLVLYGALYSGVSFWCASVLSGYVNHGISKIWCWAVFLCAFFLWISNGMLFITGRFEGYPLCNLLLPLTIIPQALFLLPYCGSSVLILFLLLWGGLVSAFFWSVRCSYHEKLSSNMYSSSYYLVLALCCLIPFCVGWLRRQPIELPDFLDRLVVLVPSSRSHNPLDVAQDIAEQLTQCVEKKRDTTLIIMPESSYPFPLNRYQNIIEMWSESLLSDDITLIVGAHRCEGANLYNTLYCIQFCRITHSYDKKHLMLLGEYVPHHFNISPLHNLFLYQKEQFTASDVSRHMIPLNNTLLATPYICSEFYFDYEKPREEKGTILCIANDSWFSSRSMRNLLCLSAFYRACEWRKNILYVTHHYAKWIDSGGYSWNISLFQP